MLIEKSQRTDRGVNAIQMVAFLGAAYKASGNQTFLDAVTDLIETHGYGRAIVNTKGASVLLGTPHLCADCAILAKAGCITLDHLLSIPSYISNRQSRIPRTTTLATTSSASCRSSPTTGESRACVLGSGLN